MSREHEAYLEQQREQDDYFAQVAERDLNEAVENLRACQRQLDMDGCEVGVSRQALEIVLAHFAPATNS
jgi:hypothetical protein